MRILGVCGSLQQASANLELLRTVAREAPEEVAVLLCDSIRDLPLFNPDMDDPNVSPSVCRWRSQLGDCDAVVIASPEYGHSLPGALKNAIDWVIGSGELHAKPVAITAAASAPERGHRGLAALRTTLQAVDARVVYGKPIVRGPKLVTEVREMLRELIETTADLKGHEP